MKDRQKAPTRGRLFYCKIAIDALGIALSGFGKFFDDTVFPSTLEVVFMAQSEKPVVFMHIVS